MVWIVGIGVFLLLFFAFPRQVGALLLGLVALAALVWVYLEVQENARERRLAAILMDASFGNGCNETSFPIRVDVRNDTGEPVERISFWLESYRPGYSSTVSSDYLSSDRILAPGAAHSECWAVNSFDLEYGNLRGVDLSTLSWVARPSSIWTAD